MINSTLSSHKDRKYKRVHVFRRSSETMEQIRTLTRDQVHIMSQICGKIAERIMEEGLNNQAEVIRQRRNRVIFLYTLHFFKFF